MAHGARSANAVAAEITQERPHVLEQWWPKPMGDPGRRLRRHGGSGQRPRRAAADPGAAAARRAVRRTPGRPGGPMPDLDALIARLQAYIRSLLGGGGPRGRFTGGRGLALIGLAVVALWLASGIYRVQPDEQGVVLRFGAYNRTHAARPQLSPALADRAGADAGGHPHQPHRDRLSLQRRHADRRAATRAAATCWKRA